MPVVPPSLLRLSLLLSLSASPLCMSVSWAEDAARRSYAVPAGSLDHALTRFAGLAGVNLSVDPALVSGLRSGAIAGEFAVEEGFALLLQGSGLQLQAVGARAYTLIRAPQGGALQLPTTSILGAGTLPVAETYAGGQVTRKGAQGLLGEGDFMDTPFNLTSYTAGAVKNLQARTLGEMVASDPSVRITNPAGGRFEQFSVRGFSLFNSDVSYGGLYGVLPTYAIDMEMVERVDILKGPGALLGGIAPRGSVGGAINIEPKRAAATPLTEFTGSYASAGQFGAAVDIARRFGDEQQFGVRFNGVKQSGDTEWEHQAVDREMSVVGLDFRHERVRLSLDLGRQERLADAPQERVEVAKGSVIPKARDIRDNFAQAWTYAHTQDTFGAVRGEFDVSDSWMVYAAAGARKGNYDFLRHGVQATQSNGDFTVVPRTFRRDEDVKTFTLGARSWFDSGPVGHTVNLSLNRFNLDFDNAGERYTPGKSNLYQPVELPHPGQAVRWDTRTHTENRFTSLALADTLSVLDERVLLTLGARLQQVQVSSWSNGVKDQPVYDEHAASPAVGLVVKVSDQLSLYSNYMEGLSQGETAPSSGVRNENAIFPPTKSKQLEVGAKYDMGSFGMSASLFRIEQPAYGIDAEGFFKANGELRNQGVELNVFGEPAEGVRLLGGVMLLDSQQTKTAQGLTDGKRGTGAPVANVNLGGEWDVERLPGLTLTARAIHTGAQYLDAANQQKIDAWQRYDLGARYSFELEETSLTLRATVENVLNTTYWASAATSSDSAPGLTLSTPRTWLVSATLGF